MYFLIIIFWVNNSLPFLDVVIKKGSNCLKRKVYRNPLKLNSVTPLKASAPWDYKTSAFRSFFQRVFLFVLNKYVDSEHDFIVDIVSRHGYKPNIILKLFAKYKVSVS